MIDFTSPFTPILILIVFAIVPLFARTPPCPDCGARMPGFVSPRRKTKRMWIAGGYLCDRCGCETDRNGAKVPPGLPAAAFPIAPTILIVVLVSSGCGLVWSIVANRALPAPAAVAAPRPDVPAVLVP
jgi:hypothetical protein